MTEYNIETTIDGEPGDREYHVQKAILIANMKVDIRRAMEEVERRDNGA